MKVRQMTSQANSVSQERKQSKERKMVSGESKLKSSRQNLSHLDNVEKRMSDLVSSFNNETNKGNHSPLLDKTHSVVIPPLDLNKSTERQPLYYKDKMDRLDYLID